MAGTCANQLTARLFLFPLKRNHGTAEHARMEQGRKSKAKAEVSQASNLPSDCICKKTRHGICRICDSRAPRSSKPALSRTAQQFVFAVWVFASGAIGLGFRSIVRNGRQLVAAPPGG